MPTLEAELRTLGRSSPGRWEAPGRWGLRLLRLLWEKPASPGPSSLPDP